MGRVAPVASGTPSRSWTGPVTASSISPTSVVREDEVGRATKRPASNRRRPLCFPALTSVPRGRDETPVASKPHVLSMAPGDLPTHEHSNHVDAVRRLHTFKRL